MTAPLTHEMMCTAGCGHTFHLLPCGINGCTCSGSPLLGYPD